MASEPNLGIFITTFLDTVEAEDIFQVMLSCLPFDAGKHNSAGLIENIVSQYGRSNTGIV
jgi:hypothetical protein